MRRLIVPIILIVLLAAGVGGGYFAGNMLHPHPPAKPAVATEPIAHGPPDADLLYDLPDLLVALSGGGTSDKVLSIAISLQCGSEDDLAKLQEYLPRVLDTFQGYLRSLSVADLRGTKALETIRAKLLERVNSVIAPGHITAVLFRSMTIQ